MTGEPSGSLFCFVSLPRRGQKIKIWRNPVLLKKMDALSSRRGEGLDWRKKERGKKEKVKKFIKEFLCLFGVLIG